MDRRPGDQGAPSGARGDAGAGQELGTTVAERLRRVQGSLSPAELKIARALMAHYPAAGLESTSGLAARAGVSPPTVVRFVARLDFDGYRQFQQSLRDEVQARRASPLTLRPVVSESSPTSELIEAAEEVGRGPWARPSPRCRSRSSTGRWS